MKTLGAVFGALVGLCLLFALALYLYLTPDRLREIVQPRIASALERDVSIGEIGLSLWSGVDASISRLNVAERPGYGQRPFVSAESASVSISLWSVLTGSPEIGGVDLKRPTLSVVIDAQGIANYEDLVEQDEEGGQGIVLPVSRLNVSDAELVYEDRRDGSGVTLSDLDYAVAGRLVGERVWLEGELAIREISAVAPGAEPVRIGPLRVVHTLRLSQGLVEIDRLTLGTGPLELLVTGTVDQSGPDPVLDIVAEGRNVDLSGLSAFLPPGLEVTGFADVRLTVEGTASDAQSPAVAGTVSVRDVSIGHPSLPHTVEQVQAVADFTPGSVEVSSLSARAGRFAVSAQGSLSEPFADPPGDGGIAATVGIDSGGDLRIEARIGKPASSRERSLDLNVSSEGLALEALSSWLPDGTTASGRASLDIALSGRLDSTWAPVLRTRNGRLVRPSLRGRVSLADVRAVTPELLLPVEDARLDLTVGDDRVNIQKASFRAGASSAAVSGTLDGVLGWVAVPESGRPAFDLRVDADTLDADALIPLPVTQPTAGHAAVSWFASPLWAASGPVDMTSPIIPIARVADGHALLDMRHVVSDGVTYRNLKATADVSKGTLTIPDLRTTVYGGKVRGRITLDVRPEDGRHPVRADLVADSVRADALLKQSLHLPVPLFGRLGMKIDMVGAVDSTLELIQSGISAEGNAAMSEGKLVNWSWLKNAGAGVTQLGFLNVDEIPIRSLIAPFSIRNDRIHLKNVSLTAAGMACRISGSAGLDGSLDYTADVDLPARALDVGGLGLGQALGGLLGSNDGIVPVRVLFRGTAGKPAVTATLQPQGVRQLDRKKEEAGRKLEEEAGKLLKKLWGK